MQWNLSFGSTLFMGHLIQGTQNLFLIMWGYSWLTGRKSMIGLVGYILHSSCCVLLILMAGKRPGKRLDCEQALFRDKRVYSVYSQSWKNKNKKPLRIGVVPESWASDKMQRRAKKKSRTVVRDVHRDGFDSSWFITNSPVTPRGW